MTFCRPTDLLPSVAKVTVGRGPVGRAAAGATSWQTQTISLVGGALGDQEMANGGVGKHPTSNDCKAGGNVCFIARPHPGPLPTESVKFPHNPHPACRPPSPAPAGEGQGEGEKVAAFGNNQAGAFAERVGEWSKCMGKQHRTSNIQRPTSNGRKAVGQFCINARPHLCPLPQERILPWHIAQEFGYPSEQSSDLIRQGSGNFSSLSLGERASDETNFSEAVLSVRSVRPNKNGGEIVRLSL